MEEKECVLASLDEDRDGAKKISPCIKEIQSWRPNQVSFLVLFIVCASVPPFENATNGRTKRTAHRIDL